MEPMSLAYEEFPASMDTAEGMKTVSRKEYHPLQLKTIVYDPEHDLKLLYITHNEKKPFIFYVQGSAWMKQDLFGHVFDLYEFAKKGFNIAICQYRDTSFGPFPLQVEDSKRGLKYMTDHSEEYGIDPEHIFLWGDSSGAHTVLMMAVTHNRLFREFTLPEIRGVVDFYGPTHIATMNDVPSTQDHMAPDSPEGRLIGFLRVDEHPELAERTVVMNYIEEGIPLAPVLMLHGTKDRLVPFRQSIELYECLKAKGKEVDFYRLEDADHGGKYFWHEESLQIVEEFLKKQMTE